MLDKSIRVKREALRKKSTGLRELCWEVESSLKAQNVLEKQDGLYKRWEFYDKLIKNIEKVENYEMQNQKNK